MKRLNTGIAIALMILVGGSASAQQRDPVQPVKLTVGQSASEMRTIMLKDTDPMRVEKGATISRGCPARDLTLITTIEELGVEGRVPGETLYAAFLAMLEARDVCAAGRARAALAIYDSALALLDQSRTPAQVAIKPNR